MQPDQAISLPKPSNAALKERITGKVRTAIEAMVWDGLPRAQAAEKAGISEHGLYKALRKPPVKAFYLSELEVLRTSERAANIHALREVRDAKSNQMATVAAVKVLEQLTDQASERGAAGATPGVVVQIVNQLTAGHQIQHPTQIDAKPLMQLDVVPSTDEERAPSGRDRR